MGKIYVFLAALVLFGGCKGSEKAAESTNKRQESLLSVDLKSEYNAGERINFIIRNDSDKAVDLLHPKELVIQMQTKNGWETVPILYCPCGASCVAPPERILLAEGTSYEMAWDQQSSWCEDSGEMVPKTIEKQVDKGTYRLVLDWEFKNSAKTMYKEFEIK